MNKNISKFDMRRLTDALNSIADNAARATALAAFREEFPEHYWFVEASGRISCEVNQSA